MPARRVKASSVRIRANYMSRLALTMLGEATDQTIVLVHHDPIDPSSLERLPVQGSYVYSVTSPSATSLAFCLVLKCIP